MSSMIWAGIILIVLLVMIWIVLVLIVTLTERHIRKEMGVLDQLFQDSYQFRKDVE